MMSYFFVILFQMKISTYHQLSKVNTTFIKYNLLLGLENLGMADCNKYYVSFHMDFAFYTFKIWFRCFIIDTFS